MIRKKSKIPELLQNCLDVLYFQDEYSEEVVKEACKSLNEVIKILRKVRFELGTQNPTQEFFGFGDRIRSPEELILALKTKNKIRFAIRRDAVNIIEKYMDICAITKQE